MQICAAKLIFRIQESKSLKDKRQIVQALKSRLVQKLNVSVAETAHIENKSILELSIVCTSNAHFHSRSIIDKAVLLAEYLRPEAELLDIQRYEFSTEN